jgi:hypothetical protein
MDPQKNFTEEDMKMVVEFLNLVAKHAKFELDTVQLIEYFKHLQFMQKSLLPKMNNHILEIKRLIEAENNENKEQEK